MEPINILPIIVSSLVAFGIGSFWYSPFLFGKEWMEGRKIKEDAIDKSSVLRSYIIQIIFSVVSFSVLAFLISMAEVRSSTDGSFLGLLTWIGFVIPISLSGLIWKRDTFTLFLIDVVYNLLILTIGGAIIGAWR
jgi:hypothetical protein